jgi:NDP-sugar pyrophosphorylase family protein
MSGACAVILAGGQGSRLRPYTSVLPKPLIPVCDVPILEVVMHQLREQGFRRILLAVNHHEGLIRSYFGDGRAYGVDIAYSKEDRPLGTVGPLRLLADELPETFLMMNGDLLTDLAYGTLLEQHASSGRLLTVCAYERKVTLGDGVLETTPDGLLSGFREKPTLGFWISAGIYALRRSVLEHIPADRAFGMDDLIHGLASERVPVGVYRHEGAWYDIGVPDDLKSAGAAFAKQRGRFLNESTTTAGAV